MRKAFRTAIMLTMAFVLLFGITTMAASKTSTKTVKYYNSDGERVYGSNKYYNANGVPMFGRGCYYYDEDGGKVTAYGCRVYYYNDGDLEQGSCYYDSYGNEVPYCAPARGRGRGCCRW